MCFVDICQEVIRLAKNALVEDRRIWKAAGFGDGISIDLADHQWRDIAAAPRPEREKLRVYLESLSLENLAKLETVMYIGRGDDDDIHSMYRHLIGLFSDKKRVADDMIQKTPLGDYLEAGLRRAAEQDLDLDGSFWLVETAVELQ